MLRRFSAIFWGESGEFFFFSFFSSFLLETESAKDVVLGNCPSILNLALLSSHDAIAVHDMQLSRQKEERNKGSNTLEKQKWPEYGVV